MAFSEALKARVRKRAHLRCCLCRQLGVEIHHILPQAEGGADTEDNAAPLCPTCHETYGANPQKRKFITEARDLWYELCQRQPALGSGIVARFGPNENRAKGDKGPGSDTVDGAQVLDFDAAQDETAEFSGTLSPAYSGGGVIAKVHFTMTSTETGDVVWALAFRRNLVVDRFREQPSAKRIVCSCPPFSASGVAEFSLKDGAEMDGVGAGDPFVVHLTRLASDPSDTAVGDSEFFALEVFDAACSQNPIA